MIQKGSLTISLKPIFQQGDDTISIEIPGLDPIEIPVHVLPGAPSKVDLSLNKTVAGVGESFTGLVTVADKWGNVLS